MPIRGKFIIIVMWILSAFAVYAEEKEIRMNDDDRKILNSYFTLFSESYLSPFESGGLSPVEVIRFTVSHLYRHQEKFFIPAGESRVKIHKKYVEAAAEKFFGMTIPVHETVDASLTYKSGFYVIPSSSGEGFVFSQVSKLVEVGPDLYLAYLNTYEASSVFTGDIHADEAAWAKGGEVPEPGRKMKALIRKIGMDDTCPYLLLEYLEEE